MKISWSLSALQERASHVSYLADIDPDAAIGLEEAISATINRLKQFPLSGRRGRVSGTREAVILNYILVYVIDDDGLNIVRLLHSSMCWPTNGN